MVGKLSIGLNWYLPLHMQHSRYSMGLGSKMFTLFCEQTSMHGWTFFGSHHASMGQRIFWFSILSTFFVLAGYLMKENISAYTNSVTTIKTVDRTANLSDAFFPSVVVCNINQLRKSFIYWLHDDIRQNELIDIQSPSIEDVFSHVKNHYFRVENEVSAKDEYLSHKV